MEMMQRKHFHVLAVDDSGIERKLLEQLLTVSSYQVTCVESGSKALEYLGHLDAHPSPTSKDYSMRSVNLIMTDYSMPGMTGYDLLKTLKESSWKDIPVIVMSSENVASRIHMCLEEGAEEFLLKPVGMADLKKLQPYIARSLAQVSGDDQKVEISFADGRYNREKRMMVDENFCNGTREEATKATARRSPIKKFKGLTGV